MQNILQVIALIEISIVKFGWLFLAKHMQLQLPKSVWNKNSYLQNSAWPLLLPAVEIDL